MNTPSPAEAVGAQGAAVAPVASVESIEPVAVPAFEAAPRALAREADRHALHQGERVWLETNCYVDLWIELLHDFGLDPRAALGFTVLQAFEGDQFTFPKFLLDDLATLYGVQAQELAIYDTLERQVQEQTRRGHVVIVEVDAFYLPDTRATSYRQTHSKTTIGIKRIDTGARQMEYFHNAGYFTLSGEDYDYLFRLASELAGNPHVLFPYAEFVKRNRPALSDASLADASASLLAMHLSRRPNSNPIGEWRAAFKEHVHAVLNRDVSYFHLYSFNVMRQLGANFELLSTYLGWLRERGFDIPDSLAKDAQHIASESMVMQFRLARARMRARPDFCDDCLDGLEASYERVMTPLAALFS
ncbi:DUF1839 family protein [Caballeronia telluris]|uniref:Succinylarginine dihydrolase n=1 Tax=Caballeronia telluris TaxID=326475 RepID=A0A158GIZ2_9BURK|nr:DUF1839 family protein [Caballeronia telluris]SAL32085.1 hypothetical protein AWB66_01833 [Caballeronia telluris]